MISSSSSPITSMRFSAMPREKQNFAMYAEFVSIVCMMQVPLISVRYAGIRDTKSTFPPKTSSPMMIQPAVCIILCPSLLKPGVDDVMVVAEELAAAADLWAKFGRGRER